MFLLMQHHCLPLSRWQSHKEYRIEAEEEGKEKYCNCRNTNSFEILLGYDILHTPSKGEWKIWDEKGASMSVKVANLVHLMEKVEGKYYLL